MNAYIQMLLHKLTLVTGKTDEEVTELAVLFFAYALEPVDSPHDWVQIINGLPLTSESEAQATAQFIAALVLARDRYLEEMGGGT